MGPTTQSVRVPPTEAIPEELITLAVDNTAETKVPPDDGAGPNLKTDGETTSPGAEAVPGTEISPRCEPPRLRIERRAVRNEQRRERTRKRINHKQQQKGLRRSQPM